MIDQGVVENDYVVVIFHKKYLGDIHICCIITYFFANSKRGIQEKTPEIGRFVVCINTYFDTICVHSLKSAYILSKFAYSYAKMRTVKQTDKLEFDNQPLFLVVQHFVYFF